MLGDLSLGLPSCFQPQSNAMPQHGQHGWWRNHASMNAVVNVVASKGTPRCLALSTIPWRNNSARACNGALAKRSFLRSACFAALRVEYRDRRRSPRRSRFAHFHSRLYRAKHVRQVPTKPSRQVLLGAKYSRVRGNAVPQELQVFMTETLPQLPWGNETTKFAA
jgi:hypothetical protein